MADSKILKITVLLFCLLAATFAYAQPDYADNYDQYEQKGFVGVYGADDIEMATAFTENDIPPTRTAVIVTHVISGDTIVVNNYGVEVGVRLADITIPDTGTLEGSACRNYLKDMIEGRAVTLEHESIRDDEGYLIAAVYFSTKNLSMQVQAFFDGLEE